MSFSSCFDSAKALTLDKVSLFVSFLLQLQSKLLQKNFRISEIYKEK